MNRTAKAWLAEPELAPCQLSKRIALAHTRLSSYPADRIHYGLMDIEPKDQESRHCSQYTGDMSGRILEFYSASEGIYGQEEPRFYEHFFRILRAQNEDGSFPGMSGLKSNHGGKILEGLVLYYKRTGDPRALSAAKMLFNSIYQVKDEVYSWLDPNKPQGWVPLPQGIALYYEETNDARCLEMLDYINAHMGQFYRAHSHGMITMHRAMMQMSRYTGNMKYAEQAEAFRRKVISEGCLNPLGDVCESFPVSPRNEGCSIADWIMLNLQAGLLYGDDEAYALAEHSMINALYFNQVVTGGFGHRAIRPWGYATNEFQEAWWCCTMNCGTGMSEYARHTVTATTDQIRINFLTPGNFMLPDAKVHIYTKWPDACDTRITIDDPLNRPVYIRIPKAMKNAQVTHFTAPNGEEIWTVSGRIGYMLEPFGEKWVLKYGAAVMIPMIYVWGSDESAANTGVPKDYIPTHFPSKNFSIIVPREDADGLIEFSHKPLPHWTYYAEGPIEMLSLKHATANVPVRFENGKETVLRFWPALANTATLLFYEIPILFNRIDR